MIIDRVSFSKSGEKRTSTDGALYLNIVDRGWLIDSLMLDGLVKSPTSALCCIS